MQSPESLAVWLIGIFVAGYLAIAFEHKLGVNKAATALAMATALWALILQPGSPFAARAAEALPGHLSSSSQIIFFLLAAMTLVEVIDAHGAFRIVTDPIRTRSQRGVLVLIGTITFFLSAVLDNLTTTIIMVSLLKRMVPEREQRVLLGCLVVIAANAGGAWTPIGDVTTTMLWIGGQVTTSGLVRELFLPSLACLATALLLFGVRLNGSLPSQATAEAEVTRTTRRGARRVLGFGLGAILLVPVLKAVWHLPPFLGMVLGLALIWVLTDVIHREEKLANVRVPHALSRVDVSGAFFFLGILLAVSALETSGVLDDLARQLGQRIHNPVTLAGLLGLVSAVIDNVPLVAAAMSMYPLALHPTDDSLWSLIAYCAGTGGSILIIGSAAGVALMGMERISFAWYLRHAAPVALAAYVVGLGVRVLIG
jgi:NhaD family Na+/H+ antiporter